MQGITKSGYKYSIDDRILKDWRFVTALTKCQTAKDEFLKLDGLQTMAKLLFGDKYEEFMDFIASKNDGYCPSEVVMTEITEIFQSANGSKN